MAREFNLDSLLRVYSTEGETELSVEAIKWADTNWAAFLKQLESQAKQGSRKFRVTSMHAQGAKGLEELRARLRMVALMTRAECEGLQVERKDKVIWELRW